MKKGLKIHRLICVAFGIVGLILATLALRHLISIDLAPFIGIWIILLTSYELHRETKKGLKIHLLVCLVFSILWFVFIVLSSLHIVSMDGILFAVLMLILFISYALHQETRKWLKIHLFAFLVFCIVWLVFIVLSNLHIVNIDETPFIVIMLILMISCFLHRALLNNAIAKNKS